MPISQLTVLALYGELHELVQRVETISETLAVERGYGSPEALQHSMRDAVLALRSAAHRAEKAGIETLMKDAPRIKVNPLTGQAG